MSPRPSSIPGSPKPSWGFTLVEVLAAVIIVAIALAALAPVLALVAYRRVLSERIEVANQLARAEVDRVRAIADIEISSNPTAFDTAANLAQLPNISSVDPLIDTPGPDELPAPDVNPPDFQVPPINDPTDFSVRLAQIEFSQDPGRNPEEYAIQSFRSAGIPCFDDINQVEITNVPCSFRLVVRVYHRLAFEPGSRQAPGPLRTEAIRATQNLGGDGGLWFQPLATQEVEINLASDLGSICRGLTDNPATDCVAFPDPAGP